MEKEKEIFYDHLRRSGLKRTTQRDLILEVFLETEGHSSAEDLYQLIKSRDPHVGVTTVYRTLKLLCDAGLANERHFDDGITRYEIEHEHHDHLVCTRCGKIIEFECAMIEATQNEIAKRHDFRVLRHRHELYGHCADCRDDAD